MNPTILGLQAQGFFIRFLHWEGFVKGSSRLVVVHIFGVCGCFQRTDLNPIRERKAARNLHLSRRPILELDPRCTRKGEQNTLQRSRFETGFLGLGLLSNQGEKSIHFYFILVPLRKIA